MRSEASVLSRVLCMAMMATLLSFAAACGGGGGGTPTGTEAESEAEGGESEAEAESEGQEAESEGGEAESESEAESEGGCPAQSCDDSVDCTEDIWNVDDCVCEHTPLHGRCALGLICDADDGCVSPPPCVTADDCPDLAGPCLRESCDRATASCVYTILDNDLDGHAPQICDEVGGDDCDDTNWDVNPGVSEFCDDEDNNCDGEVDNLPGRGLPCDWYDEDLCEDGIWDCNEGESLFCVESETGRIETCNGEDDDCNGLVDDSIDRDRDGYDAVCGGGEDCDDANWGIYPGADDAPCDGIDNNCNGVVDENRSTLGVLCDGPDDDFCREGVVICNAGGTGVTCTDATDTTVEACNGIDDDCNGVIDPWYYFDGDNGEWEMVGEPCDGIDRDNCKEGVVVCNDYDNRTYEAWCSDVTCTTHERCNGLDDDCNGVVDDGIVCPVCGNGRCTDGETCRTCSTDCGDCPSVPDGSVPDGGTLDGGGGSDAGSQDEFCGCTWQWWGGCNSPDGCSCDSDCRRWGNCCPNVCEACGVCAGP